MHWLAHQHGIAMHTPAQHPFNPLALLRLLLACAPEGGTPNRRACEAVLRHIWQGGGDANDPVRLVALTQELAPPRAASDERVKQALKDSTADALARGIFGVPTVEVDGRLFWGLDALPMLADCCAASRGSTGRPGIARASRASGCSGRSIPPSGLYPDVRRLSSCKYRVRGRDDHRGLRHRGVMRLD